MSYKKQLENLREQAYNLVELAVKNQGGRIYTFYKKNGKKKAESDKVKRFDFSPLVGIMSEKLTKPNSIGFVALHEIFLNKDNVLTCIFEKKYEKSSLFEAPFKTILSEYIYMVLYWLTFNSFLPFTGNLDEKVQICNKCKDLFGDEDNEICNNCGKAHSYTEITIDKLPESFMDKWYDSLNLMELVSINDYDLVIFDPSRNYIAVKAFAMLTWETYSYEQKKEVWLKYYNPDL